MLLEQEKKKTREKGEKASRTSSYLIEFGIHKMMHPKKLIGYSI